jgi:hypothetical protein
LHFLDIFDFDESTIDLPNSIWEAIVDLHKRLLTAIPENRRGFWAEKVDEFYKNNFRNIKPK